ncbi:hypothetical protein F5Y07DRAFT_366058 [Xylaria sp. FL0933]|nr:hypothetical protein F5Y07DRAFT_366058 [Xylaria sp. FL0933]
MLSGTAGFLLHHLVAFGRVAGVTRASQRLSALIFHYSDIQLNCASLLILWYIKFGPPSLSQNRSDNNNDEANEGDKRT